GDERLCRGQRSVPAELGVRLLRVHHSGRWRQAHARPGGRGPAARVRGPAGSRLLLHRRVEHVHINPHSKNLSASLTFIRFLTSPQAQTILATQFSEIPATTAARNSP